MQGLESTSGIKVKAAWGQTVEGRNLGDTRKMQYRLSLKEFTIPLGR